MQRSRVPTPASARPPEPRVVPATMPDLEGLGPGDDAPGPIKLLQEELIRLGYLPVSFRKDTGFGRTFGPATTAALKRFQSENGISDSGVVGEDTLRGLANPRPAIDGQLTAAHAYRDQIGLAEEAALVQADGALRQRFQRGYLTVTRGAVHVTALDGRALMPPQPLNDRSSALPTTLEGASRYFVAPWGTGPGVAVAEVDCAPACAQMALTALGLLPVPSAGEVEAALNDLDGLIRGSKRGGWLKSSPWRGLESAVSESGAKTDALGVDLPKVDGALRKGSVVVLCGDPWEAWGRRLHGEARYARRHTPGQHLVVVLGRDEQGQYLLADPLALAGVQLVGGGALRHFWAEGNLPGALAIGR